MNKASIVCLMVLLAAAKCHPEHKCNHEEEQAKLNVPLNEYSHNGFTTATAFDRLMQSTGTSTVHPMIILADFDSVEPGRNRTILESIFREYTLKRLMTFLSVNSTGKMPVIKSPGCSLNWTSNYTDGSLTADMVIKVQAYYNESVSTIASCGWCNVDSTNRPVMGRLRVNMAYFRVSGEDDIDYTANILMHETFHGLGFSGSLLNYFPNRISTNQTVYTKSGTFSTIYTMNGPNVVAWAKKQFGCSTANGMQFENQGGSGTANAHWEKTLMGNDMMTGTANGKMILTGATLAFFQDTGLYTVDFGKAEDSSWGRNQGCGFINSNCSSSFVKEFSPGARNFTCSRDYVAKTYGGSSPRSLSDNCYQYDYTGGYTCNAGVSHSNSSIGETYGSSSRCFPVVYTTSNTPYAGCYKSKCLANNTIQLTVENLTLACNTSGQKVNYTKSWTQTSTTGQLLTYSSTISITCPNITDFCTQLSASCPNDCNANGKCLINGKCSCFLFYEGENCTPKSNCPFGSDLCGVSGKAGGSMQGYDVESGSAGVLKASWLVALGLLLWWHLN